MLSVSYKISLSISHNKVNVKYIYAKGLSSLKEPLPFPIIQRTKVDLYFLNLIRKYLKGHHRYAILLDEQYRDVNYMPSRTRLWMFLNNDTLNFIKITTPSQCYQTMSQENIDRLFSCKYEVSKYMVKIHSLFQSICTITSSKLQC